MRHLGIVASSVVPASAPTVTVSSVTNFNQNRATLNGTVSANLAITTSIKFQISANNGTDWYDAIGGTSITNTSSDGVSVYYNATGYYVSAKAPDVSLSENTTYLVRLVATNSIGTSTSTTTSFTTWAMKTYQSSTVGSANINIPTVTPTNGSTIVPSIYNAFVIAGGGGANGISAGGGGGVSVVSSRQLNNATNLQLTASVGAGGGTGSNGGTSNIYGNSFTTISSTGGNAGNGSYTGSGSSGNGNAAGASAYYYDPGSGATPVSLELKASGGGGGSGGQGGAASVANSTATGGNGGTGTYSNVYSVGGGAGGGGGGEEIGFGSSAGGNAGSNNTYGAGGNAGVLVDNAYTRNPAAGGSGYVAFQYYGPP